MSIYTRDAARSKVAFQRTNDHFIHFHSDEFLKNRLSLLHPHIRRYNIPIYLCLVNIDADRIQKCTLIVEVCEQYLYEFVEILNSRHKYISLHVFIILSHQNQSKKHLENYVFVF